MLYVGGFFECEEVRNGTIAGGDGDPFCNVACCGVTLEA